MRTPEVTILQVEIAKLEPQPGDLLVFRLREPYPSAAVQEFARDVQSCLPAGIEAMILNEDMELTLVRRGASLFEPLPIESPAL